MLFSQSNTRFEDLNLNPKIREIIRGIPYQRPTEIQELLIPAISQGVSALGLASTGTGKTAAYMLPILNRLLEKQDRINWPSTIVIAPTPELVWQLKEEFMRFAKPLSIGVLAITDRSSETAIKSILKMKPDILIGHPAHLIDFESDFNIDLSGIETLVIDEADFMLSDSIGSVTRELLKKLPPSEELQTLLLSATLSSELEGRVMEILPGGKIFNAHYETPVQEISHECYEVNSAQRYPLLCRLLKEDRNCSSIVFVSDLPEASWLKKSLIKDRIACAYIADNDPAEERLKTLHQFRKQKFNVLVATGHLARGIDVSHVSKVIHYDLPYTLEEYRHRAGRTGRAGHQGSSIIFQKPHDRWHVDLIYELLEIKPVRLKTPDDLVIPHNVYDGELQVQQTIRLCESLIGYNFQRPGLLLTALRKNRYIEDNRERIQLLNLIGREALILGLTEIITRGELVPRLTDISSKLKELLSPSIVENIANKIGLNELSAKDEKDKNEIFGHYATNAEQAYYNILGAVLIDSDSFEHISRIIFKTYGSSHFSDIARLAIQTSRHNLNVGAELRIRAERSLGHEFKDTNWLDRALAAFTKYSQTEMVFDRVLISRGRSVFQLALFDIMRRCRFDRSIRDIRTQAFEIQDSEDAWYSPQGGSISAILQEYFNWSSEVDKGESKLVLQTFAGAIFSDGGFRAAQNFVERCYPYTREWIEQASKTIRVTADLDELQKLLDQEGIRVKERKLALLKGRENTVKSHAEKRAHVLIREEKPTYDYTSELRIHVQTNNLGRLQIKTTWQGEGDQRIAKTRILIKGSEIVSFEAKTQSESENQAAKLALKQLEEG